MHFPVLFNPRILNGVSPFEKSKLIQFLICRRTLIDKLHFYSIKRYIPQANNASPISLCGNVVTKPYKGLRYFFFLTHCA